MAEGNKGGHAAVEPEVAMPGNVNNSAVPPTGKERLISMYNWIVKNWFAFLKWAFNYRTKSERERIAKIRWEKHYKRMEVGDALFATNVADLPFCYLVEL